MNRHRIITFNVPVHRRCTNLTAINSILQGIFSQRTSTYRQIKRRKLGPVYMLRFIRLTNFRVIPQLSFNNFHVITGRFLHPPSIIRKASKFLHSRFLSNRCIFQERIFSNVRTRSNSTMIRGLRGVIERRITRIQT